MLAGFLLAIGLVAVMNLFFAAQRSSSDTLNVIIASQLAQEGVEVARNVRDNNSAFRAQNWLSGPPNNCSTTVAGNCDPFRYFPNGNQRCTVSYGASGPTAFTCPAGSLVLSALASGLYQHGLGVTTRFYRLVKIEHPGGADTARVQSFVTWQDPLNNLNGAGAITWCTPYNKCVYAELLLTTWK